MLDCMAVIVIIVALFYFFSGNQIESRSAVQSIYVGSRPTLQTPKIGRKSGVGHLDAVLYDFARKIDVKELKVKRNKKIARKKEVVDTSYPIEPDDFPRRESSSNDAIKVQGEDFVLGSIRRSSESSNYEGYPVTRYNPYKIASVLTRTRVLTRPSYRAVAVYVLEIGDKVEIAEKLGPWYKVISVRGQAGYVLVQDVASFN